MLALLGRANVLADLGRQEDAMRDFNRLVAIAPENAQAYLARAAAFVSFSERDEAVADYAMVAGGLQARDPAGMGMRCFARTMLGRAADGLAGCEEAVRELPNSTEALMQRGYAFLRLGRLPEARRDFEAVLRRAPTLGSAVYGRGVVRARQGEAAAAAADMAQARRLDPLVERRAAWAWLDFDPGAEGPPPSLPPIQRR